MNYELDYTRLNDNSHIQTIAILTGLSDEEIMAVTPKRNIWMTRDYIAAYKQLGFNCNPKFVPFDDETYYPCMMRYKLKSKPNGYWYSEVYYDKKIYFGGGEVSLFQQWKDEWAWNFNITSMLQVWL